jgi:hypothetical protein
MGYRVFCPVQKPRNGRDIFCPSARGAGGPHPLSGQNFSHLPGYVPTAWHQVKVVFMPKPSRDSYSGPKNYRPISLTTFMLKTMERLIDRFLRDQILTSLPLHPNQHAYQTGKSAKMDLHQLVV